MKSSLGLTSWEDYFLQNKRIYGFITWVWIPLVQEYFSTGFVVVRSSDKGLSWFVFSWSIWPHSSSRSKVGRVFLVIRQDKRDVKLIQPRPLPGCDTRDATCLGTFGKESETTSFPRSHLPLLTPPLSPSHPRLCPRDKTTRLPIDLGTGPPGVREISFFNVSVLSRGPIPSCIPWDPQTPGGDSSSPVDFMCLTRTDFQC